MYESYCISSLKASLNYINGYNSVSWSVEWTKKGPELIRAFDVFSVFDYLMKSISA